MAGFLLKLLALVVFEEMQITPFVTMQAMMAILFVLENLGLFCSFPVLQGHDVRPIHCLFTNESSDIILHPTEGASVTVNDRRIDQPVRLSQGHEKDQQESPSTDGPSCIFQLTYINF